jgi:hypothetical protein
MLIYVLALRSNNFQIVWPVISLYAVKMMHDLAFKQRSSLFLRRD